MKGPLLPILIPLQGALPYPVYLGSVKLLGFLCNLTVLLCVQIWFCLLYQWRFWRTTDRYQH